MVATSILSGSLPSKFKLGGMVTFLVVAGTLLATASYHVCVAFGPPPPPRIPPGGRGFNGEESSDNGNGFSATSSALMGILISSSSRCEEEAVEQQMQLQLHHQHQHRVRMSDANHLSSSTYMIDSANTDTLLFHLRGGGIAEKISQKRDDMIGDFKAAIDETLSYWGGALDFFDTRFLPGGRARQGEKADRRAAKVGAKASSRPSRQSRGRGRGGRKGKMTKEEKEAMKLMDTISVKAVTAPNSTILPSSVLDDAGVQSGLVGGKFLPETVEDCASRVGQWYKSSGYILNSVTGATLDADNGVAKLQVEEARVSSSPVDIVCVKEVAVDDKTGETMPIGAYRKKLAKEGGRLADQRQSFNTTLVETKAKTRPAALAGTLDLRPGEPFIWDRTKWDYMESSSNSRLFSRVWSVSPTRTPDGTVQLRVVASEAPARNLEYGISRSLYNGRWEGEVDFSHCNLFGGGERLSLMVRRGTKEPQPSFNFKFTGNALSPDHGAYDIEAFNEYIGVTGHEGGASSRRGVAVRFPRLFTWTAASAAIEKTLARTRTGEHDRLAHVSFDIGPFRHRLPANGRSSFQGTANIGSKLDVGKMKKGGKHIIDGMTPYSSYTATTRQSVPLSSPSKSSGRPISLALQHRATASTSELPEHEALAIGFAARVRGYSPRKNGPLSSSIVGTAEIRFPVPLPSNDLADEGSVVIFGDWMAASHWTIRDIKKKVKSKAVGSAAAPLLSKPTRKSSFGIGVRSVLQGIPLKVDFCITDDGKIGTHVSMGRDFAV